MNSMGERIAHALEHIAWSQISHTEDEQCRICLQKKKPVKRMPQSTVPGNAEVIRREHEMRLSRILHGPEQPVGDTFRYREIKG